MTDRLVPATLALRDDGTLVSPEFGDLHRGASGALAHRRFVTGNGLPARWQGRRTFTIVTTEFGAGGSFLAAWAAWRDDPARCERLHFVAVEPHPFSRDDLRRATSHIVADTTILANVDALVDAWPILVPGLHRLEFDEGRVVLTLAFGDAIDMLGKIVARADAFCLDGIASSSDADHRLTDVVRAFSKMAGEHATFATHANSDALKHALGKTGFTYREVDDLLVGEYAPRWRARRHEPPLALPVATRRAIVIGAGLAGCAVVERLAARGWEVTLIERHDRIASEASGNPAGVFHPLMTRDDNVASRLTRGGFLHAIARWRALERAGHAFARSTHGMIHLAESADDFARMRDAFDAFGAPSDYVSLLDADAARAHLNLPVAQGGLLFPHGGAVWPAFARPNARRPASVCACSPPPALHDSNGGATHGMHSTMRAARWPKRPSSCSRTPATPRVSPGCSMSRCNRCVASSRCCRPAARRRCHARRSVTVTRYRSTTARC